MQSLTVVIPILNEKSNISHLAKQLDDAFLGSNIIWECIWVDDGSNDDSWNEIVSLKYPHKGLRLRSNVGQSNALMAGIDEAAYEIIGTLDGDLQNDPTDLITMLAQLNESLDYIQGYRKNRVDSLLSRKVPSLIANWLARKLSRTHFRDLGCSTRIFRRSQINSVRLMGEMHRVFGLYLLHTGARALEVPVNHRARFQGKSKYGLSRSFKFVADIILYRSMRTLLNKPIYLFLNTALVGITLGGFLVLFAFFLKIFQFRNYLDATLIIGGISIINTSIVIVGIGLIAEMLARLMIRNDPNIQYQITEKTNF